MNYIKGFRYELYCKSRELSTPMCTVWIVLFAFSPVSLSYMCVCVFTIEFLEQTSRCCAQFPRKPAWSGTCLARTDMLSNCASVHLAVPQGRGGSKHSCSRACRRAELATRFEEPNPRNRWDRPLIHANQQNWDRCFEVCLWFKDVCCRILDENEYNLCLLGPGGGCRSVRCTTT